MPYYKDNSGKLHFLDHSAFEHLLPAGSFRITDDEAKNQAKIGEITQLTDEQLAAASVAEMQRRMDAYAKSWGYDDIKSAVGYVGDPFPQFDAEGVVLRNWRSAVWQWARIQESLVIAGTIQRPSSPAEFADGMPAAPTRPIA